MELTQTEDTSPEATPAVNPNSIAGLGEIIAAGIAKGMAQLQPKKVTIGQYLKARMRKVRLKNEFTQNGARVNFDVLDDREVAMANKIHRSGRYLERKVEVIVHENLEAGVPGLVEIRYSNSTIDQRMEIKGLFRNFYDLCRQIVAEQEVAEENEALRTR